MQAGRFNKLLCAVYGRPYEIDSFKVIEAPLLQGFSLANSTAEEIVFLTDIADYYCMLPVLSASLDSATLKCKSMHGIISQNPGALLIVAQMLTNEPLFRDYLIMVQTPYDTPKYTSLKDPELRKLANTVFQRLVAKVSRTHTNLWQYATSSYSEDDLEPKQKLQMLSDVALESRLSHEDSLQFPKFFRNMLGKKHSGDNFAFYPFANAIDWEELMECHLRLRAHGVEAGKGENSDDFLCDNLLSNVLSWARRRRIGKGKESL